MFSAMENLWSRIWPSAYTLKINGLESYIKISKAKKWHLYAIRCRHQRPHVCVPCAWLAKTLDKQAKIFEAGCGSGINLLWLGHKGFRNIYGADLSPEAVTLGKLLANHLSLALDIWQDNSLEPKKVPYNLDGLISLNWLYHLPDTSLESFLETYKEFLAPRARIAFDMVDSDYNNVKNNEYHTDDFGLPKAQRRPSEYTMRLSREDIFAMVTSHGFRVVRYANVWGFVPRTVWLIEGDGRAEHSLN